MVFRAAFRIEIHFAASIAHVRSRERVQDMRNYRERPIAEARSPSSLAG